MPNIKSKFVLHFAYIVVFVINDNLGLYWVIKRFYWLLKSKIMFFSQNSKKNCRGYTFIFSDRKEWFKLFCHLFFAKLVIWVLKLHSISLVMKKYQGKLSKLVLKDTVQKFLLHF